MVQQYSQIWIPEKPEIFNFKTNEVDIECGCEQKILGILNDGMLNVTSLNLTGEGSGALMDYVIEPALKLSKGYLEATIIWEGGDSVTKLIVSDGVLTNEPIEL